MDSRRSLNVNVFLRQFHGRLHSHAELVQALARGDSGAGLLNAETLRCLQRVMSRDPAERQVLAQYDGDLSRLGNAEKFCLALIKLPKYVPVGSSRGLRRQYWSALGLITVSYTHLTLPTNREV